MSNHSTTGDKAVLKPESAKDNLSLYKPRTPLGYKLLDIRKRIVASGEPLLGLEDIERELMERRGGIEES